MARSKLIYPCSYCNYLFAETLDHVIPHSYTSVHDKRNYDRSKVVPCCKECNTILGNKMYTTISERGAYLHIRYKQKYKKLLSLPDWSKKELKQIKGNLKKKIIFNLNNKEKIELKIEYCSLVRDLEPSIEDIWVIL